MYDEVTISKWLTFFILFCEILYLTYAHFRLQNRARKWKIIKRKYERLDKGISEKYSLKLNQLLTDTYNKFCAKMEKLQNNKPLYILCKIYKNKDELIDGYWYYCLTKADAQKQIKNQFINLDFTVLKWNKQHQRFYGEKEVIVTRKSFYVGDTETQKTITQEDYDNPIKFEEMMFVTDVIGNTDFYISKDPQTLSSPLIKQIEKDNK